MTITEIATNVQALLVNTDEFVTVLAADPDSQNEIAGYPCALHYYVDSQSDFATVSQNRRIYEYHIDIIIVPNAATDSVTARAEANVLIDTIVQALDESIDLSVPGNDPALPRACDIMRPAPGSLQKVETDKGTGLMMNIRLFCEADVTFRS